MKLTMIDNAPIAKFNIHYLDGAATDSRSLKNKFEKFIMEDETSSIVYPVGIEKYLDPSFFTFLKETKGILLGEDLNAKLKDMGVSGAPNCMHLGRVIYLKLLNDGEKLTADAVNSALYILRVYCTLNNISQIILPYINIPCDDLIYWSYKYKRYIEGLFKSKNISIHLFIENKNIYNFLIDTKKDNQAWDNRAFIKDKFYQNIGLFVKCPVCDEDEVINTEDPYGIKFFNHGIHVISVSDTAIDCECITCKSSYRVNIDKKVMNMKGD